MSNRRVPFTPLETALIACIAAVFLIYGFYFLLIPQSWSLMDDYKYALQWTGPGFRPFDAGVEFLKSLMSVGRFRPLDALARVLRHGYLPNTPRAFHASQLVIAVATIAAFASVLSRLGMKRVQVLWGVLLVSANLSLKDGIYYSTASELMATGFLFASLSLYLAGRRWLAALVFTGTFLSKESFVIFVGLFALIDGFVYLRTRRLPKVAPLAVVLAVTVLFVGYVKTLPALYTAGFGAHHLSAGGLLREFVLPVVKCFGPPLLLAAYFLVVNRNRAWLKPRGEAIAIGAAMVVVYTVMLAAWGPFDSWFYLHIPIPFGWAIVLAAFWDERAELQGESGWAFRAIFALCLSFFVLATLNGSRNLHSLYEDAKLMAAIGCEDVKRVPALQLYSNCDEGSRQFKFMLELEGRCPNPPTFRYLTAPVRGGTATDAGLEPPYELIVTPKCGDFALDPAKYDHVQKLGMWTVFKKFVR